MRPLAPSRDAERGEPGRPREGAAPLAAFGRKRQLTGRLGSGPAFGPARGPEYPVSCVAGAAHAAWQAGVGATPGEFL